MSRLSRRGLTDHGRLLLTVMDPDVGHAADGLALDLSMRRGVLLRELRRLAGAGHIEQRGELGTGPAGSDWYLTDSGLRQRARLMRQEAQHV